VDKWRLRPKCGVTVLAKRRANPYGCCAFRIGKIFRGAMPFLLANLITLSSITYLPQLSLWLPALFFDLNVSQK